MRRTWDHQIRALSVEQQHDGRRCLHCPLAPLFHACWQQSVCGRAVYQQRRLCLLHGRMFADKHGLPLPPVQVPLPLGGVS